MFYHRNFISDASFHIFFWVFGERWLLLAPLTATAARFHAARSSPLGKNEGGEGEGLSFTFGCFSFSGLVSVNNKNANSYASRPREVLTTAHMSGKG
jgi:hypothetical protein